MTNDNNNNIESNDNAISNEERAALLLDDARKKVQMAFVVANRSHTQNGTARRGDHSRFVDLFSVVDQLISSLENAEQEHQPEGGARDGEEGQPLTIEEMAALD